MPGPEDLTQRLLWLGATQSLCARAEESGASAEIVELHQNDLSLDSLCHLPKPEFGCSRKRVHRQMRLAGIASVEKPGLQSHHQLPAQPPRRPPLYSKETSFLSNPIRPGWVISPAFPPERAGLYPAIVKGLCTGKRVGYAFSSPIDTVPTLEALGRAVRRLRRHERASPRMSRVHSAFPGVLRPFFREGLKDKTLRHFHSCERALKPCSDSF